MEETFKKYIEHYRGNGINEAKKFINAVKLKFGNHGIPFELWYGFKVKTLDGLYIWSESTGRWYEHEIIGG